MIIKSNFLNTLLLYGLLSATSIIVGMEIKPSTEPTFSYNIYYYQPIKDLESHELYRHIDDRISLYERKKIPGQSYVHVDNNKLLLSLYHDINKKKLLHTIPLTSLQAKTIKKQHTNNVPLILSIKNENEKEEQLFRLDFLEPALGETILIKEKKTIQNSAVFSDYNVTSKDFIKMGYALFILGIACVLDIYY